MFRGVAIARMSIALESLRSLKAADATTETDAPIGGVSTVRLMPPSPEVHMPREFQPHAIWTGRRR